MKIERYKQPTSSFLSVDKDIETIMGMMWENPRLKRLLFRQGNDPLNDENLTDEESLELLRDGYIRNVPNLPVDDNVKSYIIISFNRFTPSKKNPHFRDNLIIVDILCHFDQWRIGGGFQLRPLKIAGEVDSMLDGARLSGIGVLNFAGANYISAKDFGGYSLIYAATHADDDKKGFNNPADEEKFLEDIAEGLDG